MDDPRKIAAAEHVVNGDGNVVEDGVSNRANIDNTWTEIPHNIENIDNICDYDVLIKAPDQGVDYWYILSNRGNNNAAATYISKENIGIINTWLSGSSTWYFTIKYTKLIETIN